MDLSRTSRSATTRSPSSIASRAIREPRSARPTTRATSARSTRCMFGMLGARAMAQVRLGRFEEAADWGIKAAARPNAHVHFWRSPPIASRWPAGSRRRALSPPRSTRRCRTIASTIFSPRSASRPTPPLCSARAPGASGSGNRPLARREVRRSHRPDLSSWATGGTLDLKCQ